VLLPVSTCQYLALACTISIPNPCALACNSISILWVKKLAAVSQKSTVSDHKIQCSHQPQWIWVGENINWVFPALNTKFLSAANSGYIFNILLSATALLSWYSLALAKHSFHDKSQGRNWLYDPNYSTNVMLCVYWSVHVCKRVSAQWFHCQKMLS